MGRLDQGVRAAAWALLAATCAALLFVGLLVQGTPAAADPAALAESPVLAPEGVEEPAGGTR